MDKEKLIRTIEKIIKAYEELNSDVSRGATIAMTSLLELIKSGEFDK